MAPSTIRSTGNWRQARSVVPSTSRTRIDPSVKPCPGGSDEVRLGEEFHHNGLGLRCAQIARVPRGTGHLWDRERLSTETLALLAADGEGITRHIITDYTPLSEAPETLVRLAASRHDGLQLVFT